MTSEICTGGDVRGQTIANFFKRNKQYQVSVCLPKIASKKFNFSKIIIGNNILEKTISKPLPFFALILFWTRTMECLINIKKFKTDVLYLTGDFFCNTIPAFFIKNKYPKTKFVVCIHHINENPFKRKSNFLFANIFSFSLQQLSFFIIKKKADMIFTVNFQVKNYLEKHNFRQKIFVTGNGLDIHEIKNELKKLNVTPENRICFFGRVSPTKGIFDLPEILSLLIPKHPDIHLDIIGIITPKISSILKKKFEQKNCQGHFTIHNFIKQKKDIYEKILKSKVSVFPSYEEGWGISLFESIMCQRPVVAYNLPVYKELFNNKLYTVPIGNIFKMSSQISYFFKNYQNKKTLEYVQNCFQIAQKYDWENVFLKEKKCLDKYLI